MAKLKNQSRHQQIEEFKIKNSAPISYCSVSFSEFELETRSSNLDKRIVEGYGNIWNKKNGHGEKVLKGAWDRSIKENGPGSNAAYQIKFRDEHGKACSLFEELRGDDIGLYFKTKPLDDVPWSDNLLTQLRSGTINNFSNGFRFIWDKVEWDEEDDALMILEGRLLEISAVVVPSDMETFTIRNASEEYDTLLDETELYIKKLPREFQLEARKIITRHISLIKASYQHEEGLRSIDKSDEAAVDYRYLIDNLKNHF